MMLDHDCGQIPVVDSAGSQQPIGVVTDRDIVVRMLAHGKNFGGPAGQSSMYIGLPKPAP